MFKRFVLQAVVSFVFVCLIASCGHIQRWVSNKTTDGIDRSELPKWTVSLAQIVKYPRANPGEKEVPSYHGENIWVRKHFELNSKLIELVTTIPLKDSNKLNLKLKLDKHGTMVAMRLCNESPQPLWGVLIDGIYYGNASVAKATSKEDDYSEILLECAIDKATANAAARYSSANYEHFHKNDK